MVSFLLESFITTLSPVMLATVFLSALHTPLNTLTEKNLLLNVFTPAHIYSFY